MANIILIFGFSVSNYVYLVTFGRKIKSSIFCQFSCSGTQLYKGLNNSPSDLFVKYSSSFMSSSSSPLLNAFSIPYYVYLVTFGRKIKSSIFCQFSCSGTQLCKGLNNSPSDIFVKCSPSFMSSIPSPFLMPSASQTTSIWSPLVEK